MLRFALLVAVSVPLAACERANPYHCSNRAEGWSAFCQSAYGPEFQHCSTCRTEQRGCLDEPVLNDDCRPSEDGVAETAGSEMTSTLSASEGMSVSTSPSTTADTSDSGTTAGPDPEPVCGNGVRELPDENCDESDLGGMNCEAIGLGDGELSCYGPDDAQPCTFNLDGCSTNTFMCQDGVAEGTEQCDGMDLNDATCADIPGFGNPARGGLQCDATCRFDTSQCCLNGGEACVNNTDCCTGVCFGLLGEKTCTL